MPVRSLSTMQRYFVVCRCLVAEGETQDEEGLGGRKRAEALVMLCEMCPSYLLTIRSLCVSGWFYLTAILYLVE